MLRAVSIPQSGFGAFEPDLLPERVGDADGVSIPQSGFGAFEPPQFLDHIWPVGRFQSLSRDSGRLNQIPSNPDAPIVKVSIPQSGFGAFELPDIFACGGILLLFQSLSRDSGRLNYA